MIEERIREKSIEAIEKLYKKSITEDKIQLERTRKEFEGDITLVIFPLTKFTKSTPERSGEEIGNYLLSQITQITKFNVIKGFLNLLLDETYWLDFFNKNAEKVDFGFIPHTSDLLGEDSYLRPILIEYSSPNTNKPLHLGHIRNNLLGYSLAEILKAYGKAVVKVNLVNDRGIHICKSMLGWKKWSNGETPESSGIKGDHLAGKYYVLFDKYYKEEIEELLGAGLSFEEAEKRAPLIIEAQEMLRKWEEEDKEVRAIWRMMNEWVYKGFNETYKTLGVDFDKTYYESDTYLLGKDLVREGLERNIFYRKEDGTICVDLREEGLDEKVVLRADGTSVYITQDLGTAQERYEEYNPQKMLYVVGNEQNYHFEVLKLILKKLGKPYADGIEHLSYGMVELPEGKMKSREGTVVDADVLVKEMLERAKKTTEEHLSLCQSSVLSPQSSDVGNEELYRMIALAALKYFILKVDPQKSMLFDPEESIDFNGNTGPFIQYTYARIQSLLVKSLKLKVESFKLQDSSFKLALLPEEKYIIKLLYEFPDVIKEAAESYNPALVANYVYELAKEYNHFYQEIPVLKAENPQIVSFRVKLSEFTGKVIKSSMKLLGIDVPLRM